MANLYEINEQILNCIDLETGEIIDIAKFDELQIERDEKLENIALWHKNLLSEAAAYKSEKKLFEEREKRAISKAESLKNYLEQSLRGSKFRTTKVEVSYRKSATLEYDGETDVPEEYLKYSDPTIDKAQIKDAIKSGKEISGFTIVEHNNIQIK